MVTTVTINPAVDKTYIVNDFSLESVNRAERIIYNAGSKGINVSRVLKQTGTETMVLGFVGGMNGELLLNELATEGIKHRLVNVKGNTRLNVKIMDKINKRVTEINEAGTPVSDAEVDQFMEIYKEQVKVSRAVVISGSILPEMYKKIYYELIKIAKNYDKMTFLDCGGSLLYDGILASPDYIKPNIFEFEDMLGKKGLSNAEIVVEARKIIEKYGVKNVIITLGSNGAIAVSETESFKVLPPKIEAASTVGAGDAFLAGVCHGALQGFNLKKQMVLGTSYACAKITKEGTIIPSMIELAGYLDGCQIVALGR